MSVVRIDFEKAAQAVRTVKAIKRAAFSRQSSTDVIMVNEHERDLIAHFLANWFEKENPDFDRSLFLNECAVVSQGCPGCGKWPSQGVTAECNHPHGCGFRP